MTYMFIRRKNEFAPLQLEEQSTVTIVDELSDNTNNQEISVPAWCTLNYFFLSHKTSSSITITTTGEWADVRVYWLLVWTDNQCIDVTITSKLASSHSSATMHIVSLLGDCADVNVDAWVVMPQWLEKLSWHLLEENVIVGKQIKIHTLPRLDVQSNDVRASHGAKVHRLDPIKLFYLTAKWMSTSTARQLMIDSYVQQMIDQLPITDKQKHQLEDTKQSFISPLVA